MKIILYSTDSSNNTVNKKLKNAIELTGTLRAECSVVNPVLNIETDVNISHYNYVWIDSYKRYYFISDIVAVNNNLWRISLRCDVLMSYALNIKRLTVNVLRNSSDFHLMLEDNQLKTYADSRIQCYNFPTALTSTENQFKYYLTLIGGGDNV